jgi:LmbE family N-acetylglucosaminyl deacetylase
MPDRPLTLMAVHAHPDDEATSTGGVFSKAAAEGIRTVLVTCTDGSCGDAPGGIKPGEPGHDPAAVAALRLPELQASCELLGIQHLELLGYTDSGMMGWPSNDAPGSFWKTPVETAAARLAELIDKYQPDVVVTYDEYGFYGHPDHIQANRITVAAMAMSGSPAKLYWATAPRSMMARMGEIVRELGGDWDEDEAATTQATGEPPVEIGLPDEEISTWVDVAEYGPAKFKALAAHASQSENIFFLQMGVERFTEMWGTETFSRIQDTTGAALPETDLFAGLR